MIIIIISITGRLLKMIANAVCVKDDSWTIKDSKENTLFMDKKDYNFINKKEKS